jgi:hypothetical protein
MKIIRQRDEETTAANEERWFSWLRKSKMGANASGLSKLDYLSMGK